MRRINWGRNVEKWEITVPSAWCFFLCIHLLPSAVPLKIHHELLQGALQTPSQLTALGAALQCCLGSQCLETWPASFPLLFTYHRFVNDQDLSVLPLSHQPTCLHPCCHHPSPTLAHLVFLTLDQSPSAPSLYCNPWDCSNVQT